MTTTSFDARSLPPPLRRGLDALDRKLRAIAAVRGLGGMALVLAILAVMSMIADFLWPLPIAARWGLWAAWIAVGAMLIVRILAVATRRTPYLDLAAVADRGNPGLDERISSAVELIGHGSRSHGSPVMISALGEEAASQAEASRLDVAVSSSRAGWIFVSGLLVSAVVIAPAVVAPGPYRSLMQRFLQPWRDVERVARFVVEVAPGDAVVAIGSEVDVVAKVSSRLGDRGLPHSALLEWTDADNRSHKIAMTAEESVGSVEANFRASIPRLLATIRYRVVAGSAESRVHTLTAVDPPRVATISARVEPPSYMRRSAVAARNPDRIEAPEGSRITLTITPSKPLQSALVQWPGEVEGKPQRLPMTSTDSGQTWTASIRPLASGPYEFILEDTYRIANAPEPPRRIVLRPDAPPSIRMGGSPDPKDAQGDDFLVVNMLARDDVAVMTSDLLYTITRSASSAPPPGVADEGTVAAEMQGLTTPKATGEASLSLKGLDLRTGDLLSYRVRVSDNRPEPKGPNVVFSQPRSLRIVDKAEPLLAREQAIQRQSLQDALNAIKKSAADNRQTTEALRYAADSAQRGNGEWTAARQAEVTKLETEARAVVDNLHVLARDFTESGQFAPLARLTKQIADVEAESGRDTVDQARRADDPARRLAALRAADDRMVATRNRLDELQRKFDELARLDDDRRKLRELAEQQDDLARRAEALAENPEPSAIEALQQEQDRLRGQIDEIAQRSPELKAEALAARVKDAENLAKQAHELAERQRDEARKTADPSGRAERLKAIAEAQKRLEDDARRLALEVDRPLEENSRARIDAGALARAVEPIERGEIDQGRQRLDEAESALRRLARDLDEVRDDPKAMARRLARRQDALKNQVGEVVRTAQTPEQKQTLAEKLKPFVEPEDALRKLAAALPVPENLKGLANEALQSIDQSIQDLKTNGHEQVQNRQNEARDRLNRLADALPDRNGLRQQTMNAVNEARSRIDQVANELTNHLRDTAPRPGQKDFDPEAAARELARRVTPLADRQAEAVKMLANVQTDRQAEPQRDRALERARKLADTLDRLRDAAPPESNPSDAKPNADWRVLGAFDDAKANPPFAIDRPIDLKAAFNGRKGTHPVWKPVQSGADGLVDLGVMYSRDDNQSAFAYAEVQSPVEGKGRLLVGSDDFMMIWLNGKHVYSYNNARSWQAAQDRVEVNFAEGPNRLLIRCGNGNSEWKFSVAVLPPATAEQSRPLQVVQELRGALPAIKTDAAAAVERLQQILQDREPADNQAAQLADDLKALDDANRAPNPDAPSPADEMRRIATALRNLPVPDALAQQTEAIRQAEQAAAKTSAGAPDAAQSREQAARTVEAMARRLTDTLSPSQRAEALVQAQKGLAEPDANQDVQAQARAQQAIADEVAALPTESPARVAAVDASAKAAEMANRQAQRPDLAPSPEAIQAAREEAAKAIAVLAQNAEPPAVAQDKPADAPLPRDQVRGLAARQHALAERAKAVKPPPPDADPVTKAQAAAALDAMARDQDALAEAVRDVADPLPAGSPARKEAEDRRDAARSAQARALGAMESHQPSRAAERAEEAARALDNLASALPEAGAAPPFDPRSPAPADPDLALNEDHVRGAQALANRERMIRERLQAVMGERVAPQEALRDEATALGQQIANLREETRPLSPRSQNPANSAADLLQNQAPRTMNEGLQQLNAGRPDPARDTQRRAAEILEHAAQQAEDLAGALRSELADEGQGQGQGQGQAQGEPAADAADLGSAREAQREASRRLSQARETPPAATAAATQGAGESMRQAARGLRAAASSGPKAPGSRPSQAVAESSDRDPQEGEAGRDEAHLAELKEAIKAKTGRNWGELPGHLRSEILQMSQGKYREDYARLIGLYFREIAAGRDEKEAKP